MPAIYSNNYRFIESLISQRPEAQIIHILSHDQRKGFYPVLEADGEPFVDEFGYPVFVAREVDWFGELTDIDERYTGTDFTSLL